MVKIRLSQNQASLFFLLPGVNTNIHYLTPFCSQFYGSETDFYRKTPEEGTEQTPLQKESSSQIQEDEVASELQPLKMGRKATKVKKIISRNDEYKPKKRVSKQKEKKVYQKDKERNVLPNAISKLFFFLKSMPKSHDLLKATLSSNPTLQHYVCPRRYYAYQKVLWSKMGRFMTEESIGLLFGITDEQFTIFSQAEQLAFIKVNAIMLRFFVRKHLYINHLLSSSRTETNKIRVYCSKYREIEKKADFFIQKARNTLNFHILNKSVHN